MYLAQQLLIQIKQYIDYIFEKKILSKIGMNLWIVYIGNMKSSGKYNLKRWEEGECTLHCWPKSSEIYDCSRIF